jgi:hypothetical protein
LEQALDNVPSIVANIVCAALGSMQPPEQHEEAAAARAKLARFATKSFRKIDGIGSVFRGRDLWVKCG